MNTHVLLAASNTLQHADNRNRRVSWICQQETWTRLLALMNVHRAPKCEKETVHRKLRNQQMPMEKTIAVLRSEYSFSKSARDQMCAFRPLHQCCNTIQVSRQTQARF